MRLTEEEKKGIINAFARFKLGANAELRLYGSRTKDHLKGGDIDLLLIIVDQDRKELILWQKPEILVAIKKLIGERRIDLKIAVVAELQDDPFLQSIYPDSLLLHLF